MKELLFPQSFVWGAATAAYQVEGAAGEDGRGESIWDRFCRIPGKVWMMQNGDIADDQYHRYPEDVSILKGLGFSAYRLSLSWSRIFPDGVGRINPKGVVHYHQLFESLLENHIEPYVTLCHWDLPQGLQEKGGWVSRDTAVAFSQYCTYCFEEFREVKYWFTLNEPICSAVAGYLEGRHAPGHTSLDEAVHAIHNLNYAHGLAVRLFHEKGYNGKIGVVLNPSYPQPASKAQDDAYAADLCKAWTSDVFTSPMFQGHYPELVVNDLGLTFPIEKGDLETIKQPLDYVGVNYYFEQMVRRDSQQRFGYSFVPRWQKKTEMGWPIVPEGLLHTLKTFSKETCKTPIIITENGMALADELQANGSVEDFDRIQYLREHLLTCLDGIQEGLPIEGYFVWSLLDNFEWAWGYSKRFGIVFVDYQNGLQRTIKNSGYYLRDVIRQRKPL